MKNSQDYLDVCCPIACITRKKKQLHINNLNHYLLTPPGSPTNNEMITYNRNLYDEL